MRRIPDKISKSAFTYVSGSRKDAPAVQLTIHVNPVTTLVFAIGLAHVANVFAPSPK